MGAGSTGVNFNPRSREGSDEDIPLPRFGAGLFQSTLPRRERQMRTYLFAALTRFQSTLPRRERPLPANFNIFIECISIHAPAKGATDVAIHDPAGVQFQSTLPRRERQGASGMTDGELRFQSTLPRRERLFPGCFPVLWLYFNPRSREGSDDL